MALLTTKPAILFDVSQINKGDLIWAKHKTWEAGKAGFIISVTEEKLVAQYHPGIGNITNHFIIPVEEAEKEWDIRWSRDLSETKEHISRKGD